jgi:diguanylate cyclase (GGDEF)-like protein
MISEHDKGNTDYTINLDEFNGDYKILAANILNLTALGLLDQLTGIPNRRCFDNRLDMEWKRAMRDKKNMSILMLDIDKFKNYNDTFGHQQGDVALKTVAKKIKETIKRPIDFAARWGGEEFVVLLPNTDSNGSLDVGEHIRKIVEDTEIPCAGKSFTKLTVSVGVNTQIPKFDGILYKLISGADEALYSAKKAGRNRVCLFEDGHA